LCTAEGIGGGGKDAVTGRHRLLNVEGASSGQFGEACGSQVVVASTTSTDNDLAGTSKIVTGHVGQNVCRSDSVDFEVSGLSKSGEVDGGQGVVVTDRDGLSGPSVVISGVGADSLNIGVTVDVEVVATGVGLTGGVRDRVLVVAAERSDETKST